MPKASCMAKQKRKLSISDRLVRLRAVVENLPDGDQDKEDLMLLFGELDRVKRLHRAVKNSRTERRHVGEDNRRLRGALRLAKFALKTAIHKINEQKVTIGWLCRRIKRGESLSQHERKEVTLIERNIA